MNKISISGKINKDYKPSHIVCGERFLKTTISCRRKSGVYDDLPVVFSEVFFKDINRTVDNMIWLNAEIRTINKDGHLETFIFVLEVLPYNGEDINEVEMEGYLCMTPFLRKTLRGRFITDAIIAINKRYGKSFYVPTITWGRTAIKMSRYSVGTKIEGHGRFQSRVYHKSFDNGDTEERVAYEVSLNTINKVTGKEESYEN